MREMPNGIVHELKANHGRRQPMRTEAMQRRAEARKAAAIRQYMRENLITEGEAELMYAEHGIYAPRRRYRR